ASAINGIGNYLLDEKVIQPYLDGQLHQVSSMIRIMSTLTEDDPDLREEVINYLQESQTISKKHFIFQVWDNNGKLLMQSHNNNNRSFYEVPIGFSDEIIDGDDWRIYAEQNKSRKLVVAELYNLRRELTDDIAKSNANILLIT